MSQYPSPTSDRPSVPSQTSANDAGMNQWNSVAAPKPVPAGTTPNSSTQPTPAPGRP